jgi:hypothetical protein
MTGKQARFASTLLASLAAVLLGCGEDPDEVSPESTGGAAGTPNQPTACDIDSGFPGDEACLLPPHPREGMQIHVGPRDYTDLADVQKFILEPGDESSECWSFHTPNTEDVYFQSYELRGRPGTHHIINTMYQSDVTDGGFSICKDPGTGSATDILSTLPGASRPHMPLQPVAPENSAIAQLIPAQTATQADMHYFNTTTSPILREFWLNIYFVPRDQVTASPKLIRGMGGLSWNSEPIAPGTHETYAYSCPINADGRILSLLGHTHAHGIRETAWVKRASGERIQVFEQFDYADPRIFYYDSITENPAFSQSQPGAQTGILEVFAGDALEWECEVNNDSDQDLTYINDVMYGEMCNIWGQTVGPLIDCVLP